MSEPGSLIWFARHECRLTWRDWLSMMTAGRRRRARSVVIGMLIAAVVIHAIAYLLVGPYGRIGSDPGKATLLVITGSAVLSWALMLSQALESVTRGFYARADLDLILSSPVSARRLFAVRIAAMGASVAAMAMLLAAPLINVLAFGGGWRWLGAYGVVAALGTSATAVAVALTMALFRMIGPKRTRLVAQIVAAVIGAGFVIGLQIVAITSYGTMSRFDVLQSERLIELAPGLNSVAWWPARAVLGDAVALVAAVGVGAVLLGAAIIVFAPRFAGHAVAAAGIGDGAARRRRARRGFRRASQALALRRKEWTLLRRDPWLASQTLMQLLYLVPPAVLLWRSFAAQTDAAALLVPVLVMAAGQLAGGLAWLAISGEDAPELIASAPVRASGITRARIEAVMGAVAAVFAPFGVALAFMAPTAAAIAALGIAVAAASATAIQLWFRSQAKRSHFRRRQTSSRVATFAEALVSVGWAGTGALAAMGSWLAAMAALLTVVTLIGAWRLSPARS